LKISRKGFILLLRKLRLVKTLAVVMWLICMMMVVVVMVMEQSLWWKIMVIYTKST
jgi:hypothetical protein